MALQRIIIILTLWKEEEQEVRLRMKKMGLIKTALRSDADLSFDVNNF